MLTWLYVPGDRPDRFAKAVASGADAVILDLEDAVHPVAEGVRAGRRRGVPAGADHAVPLQVRINALDGAGRRRRPGRRSPAAAALAGLRLPKVRVAGRRARRSRGRPERRRRTAAARVGARGRAGVRRSRPRIRRWPRSGSARRTCVRISASRDDAGLAYARGRVVLAARAAGLPAPAMSVYPDVRDLAGLAASCRAGPALGFVGRAAIHPAPVAGHRGGVPADAGEVAAGRGTAGRAGRPRTAGHGTAVLPDGRFADRRHGRAPPNASSSWPSGTRKRRR